MLTRHPIIGAMVQGLFSITSPQRALQEHQPQTDHCPALYLLLLPGRLLLLLPQIPATFGHGNKDCTAGNRRRLEAGKEIAGSIYNIWKWPVLKPSHWEHKGGEEKQVQQARHVSWMESRCPVLGQDECCWSSWRPSCCSPQLGNPRRVLQTQHTGTPELCMGDGLVLLCTTAAMNKRAADPLLKSTLILLKHFRKSHRREIRTVLLIQGSDVSALNSEAMPTNYCL